MKHFIENIHDYISSKPIIVGATGTIAGWGSAMLAWIGTLKDIFATLGVAFGSVAAFYSMLIVMRNYYDKKNGEQ